MIPSLMCLFRKILLVISCCICTSGWAQDIYNLENSQRYAEYLYNTNRFSLSAREYQRLLFMSPHDTSIQLSLLRSYRGASEYNSGLMAARRLYPVLDSMPGAIAMEYGYLLVNNKQYNDLLAIAHTSQYLTEQDKGRLILNYYTLTQQWKEASQFVQKDLQLNNQADYQALIAEGLAYKPLRPGTALGLSALVPGLGKVYTRDWKDGLVSFLMVGGNAFQAYRGFSKQGVQSVSGWIFTGLGTGFYIGNLYGSHKAARYKNARFKKKMEHEASRIVLGTAQ
jgi:hypothetical protein